MKAAVTREFGGPETIKVEEMPKPEMTGDQDLIVKIAYSAYAPIDTKLISGDYRNVFPTTFPLIPGLDFSGVVSESKQPDFPVGAKVYGRRNSPATNAEYASFNTKSDIVTFLPKTLSLEEAACLGTAALTSVASLIDKCGFSKEPNLNKDKSVLIIGASGNVGRYAVQFAKSLGLTVIGVCSTNNVDMVKSLGAKYVIDYRKQPDLSKGLEELGVKPASLDGVLHYAGGDEYYFASEPFMKPGAYFVSASNNDDHGYVSVPKLLVMMLSIVKRNLFSYIGWNAPYVLLTSLPHGNWDYVEQLAKKGGLKHAIHKTFKLVDIVEAHKEGAKSRFGSILIKI